MNVPEHIGAVSACLEGKQPPVVVVHMQVLPRSGATGLTSVDGFGAAEHCSSQSGRVLLRQPSDARPEHFAGLPSFVLGGARPSVPPERLLEEVVHDQRTLGWLYWNGSAPTGVSGGESH